MLKLYIDCHTFVIRGNNAKILMKKKKKRQKDLGRRSNWPFVLNQIQIQNSNIALSLQWKVSGSFCFALFAKSVFFLRIPSTDLYFASAHGRPSLVSYISRVFVVHFSTCYILSTQIERASDYSIHNLAPTTRYESSESTSFSSRCTHERVKLEFSDSVWSAFAVAI